MNSGSSLVSILKTELQFDRMQVVEPSFQLLWGLFLSDVLIYNKQRDLKFH